MPIPSTLFIDDLLPVTSNAVHSFADDSTLVLFLSLVLALQTPLLIVAVMFLMYLQTPIFNASSPETPTVTLHFMPLKPLCPQVVWSSPFSPHKPFESSDLRSTGSDYLLGLSINSLFRNSFTSELVLRTNSVLFRARGFFTCLSSVM